MRAENGLIAVDICRNNVISLILMDIRMPEMDGLDATRLIRTFNPALPVIAQTAYSLPNDVETALKAGCNSVITKPINRKTILSVLNEYLNND
jgi:CheY-like chemotaxis protein